MSTTTDTSTVPFSPVPGHFQPMKFDASDEWTYDGTPLMVLAKQNFRDASLDLVVGREEEARRKARTALAMEDAYLRRARDEDQRGAL